jgi:hypothetical protein
VHSLGEKGESLQGDALVVAAASRLTYGPSLTARLHQRVRHAGGEVFGIGAYWQEAFQRGGRFKLELRTKTSHLRVVGDGTYIWRQAAIHGEQRITRIDLKQTARLGGVPAARIQTPLDPRVQDERSVAPLSFGGLPHLLQSLARTYRFESARAAVLSDVPVFELKGVQDEAASSLQGVSPPQVPSHAIISLGQDDLFPYRIVFEWKGIPAGQHDDGVPLRVEMFFFDVSHGPSIDTRHFEYSRPRDAPWEDITAEVVAAAQRHSHDRR